MNNLREIVGAFLVFDNPALLDILFMSNYKGFELWKGSKGSRDFIYIRYTGFERPAVVEQVGSMSNVLLFVSRLCIYKTPFTSVKAVKDFINSSVMGV